jgi:DNA-binding NarL/FixJ family response regulator
MADTTEVPSAFIFNVETGESYIQPLTTEEIAELQVMQAQAEAQQAEQDAKAAARQSALAKLTALGLTQEEVEAL